MLTSEIVESGNSETAESDSAVITLRNVLRVGFNKFNNINPFIASDSNDLQVVEMSTLRLLTIDRNGEIVEDAIDGKLLEYNNEVYQYFGISNVSFSEQNDGTVDISIKLRDDIKCSDGSLLSVDDVIFSMYVLSDPSYSGSNRFSELPILGMNEYKNGNALNISGIERVSATELKLSMCYFEESFVSALNIFVAPLGFYGNKELYDYDADLFGFSKGNIEAILSKNMPFGAGPYIYASCDENTIKFKRNPWYYKGIPNMELIEFSVGNTDNLISKVTNGEFDIINIPFDEAVYNEIIEINGEEDGFLFNTCFYSNENDSCAVIINAQSMKFGTYSGEYTDYYSWISEIHSFKLNYGY